MMENRKKNNYRSNLAIRKKRTFLFNSAAISVTSTLYPSYLIVFLVKMSTLPCCGRHIGCHFVTSTTLRQPNQVKPSTSEASICLVHTSVYHWACCFSRGKKTCNKKVKTWPPSRYQAYRPGTPHWPSGQYGATRPIFLVTRRWPCNNL